MHFADDFCEFLRKNSRKLPAGQVSHSETEHPEHFIPVPDIRDFVATWIAEHPPMALAELIGELDDLYAGESLEERCVGGILLGKHSKLRRQLPLKKLDEWLHHLVGWKEVDSTCQAVFLAPEILARWPEWEAMIMCLSQDKNINRRRASLVLLVVVVRSSDDERGIELAIHLVRELRHERDKRIAKAVSWVLREAIRRHRSRVEKALSELATDLAPATIREVQTKLDTGKKTPRRPADI